MPRGPVTKPRIIRRLPSGTPMRVPSVPDFSHRLSSMSALLLGQRGRQRAPHFAALGFWLAATVTPGSLFAQATPAPPKPVAHPDYKTLRFDELWTAPMRTAHWDDAIKAIPLSPNGVVTITLAGQMRWRDELFRNFNLTSQNDDNSQSRLALSADLAAGDRKRLHARVFGEARDEQAFGRTLPGGTRTSDADRHDIQNLFADVGYGASYLRYGRQEIPLNRERLFGVPDWSNTRRALEGTHALLVHGAVAVEAIDARPVLVRLTASNRPDSTTRFRTLSLGSAPGAAPLAAGLPALWQGYWYEQTVRTPTTLTRRLTSGGRTQWNWGAPSAKRSYTLEFEGAVQGGHAGTRTLDAWFYASEAQAQFRKLRGAPTLAAGLEEASGENPATTTASEAFFLLYPAAHQHGGYADVIGRPNVRELHLVSTWDPYKSLSLRAAAYRFDRRHTSDGVWTKQNSVLRAANGSTAMHAADEVDLTGTWKATRHLRLIAGGAVVLPSEFLKTTPGGAQTERWAFVGTTFTF